MHLDFYFDYIVDVQYNISHEYAYRFIMFWYVVIA